MNIDRKEQMKLISLIVVLAIIVLFIGYIMIGYINSKKVNNPKVTITLKDRGEIVLELYPNIAPNTVANFLALVNSGYYNNKIVYGKDINVIHFGRSKDGQEEPAKLKDIGINENGNGEEKYSIKGEFKKNGIANDLPHKKYVVSMSRADYTQIIGGLKTQSYNSANGLFNIVMEEDTTLDGNYAAFGKVIKGQEVLDKLFKEDTVVKEDKDNRLLLKRFKKVVEIEKIETDAKVIPKVDWIKAFDLDKFLTEEFKKQDQKSKGKN